MYLPNNYIIQKHQEMNKATLYKKDYALARNSNILSFPFTIINVRTYISCFSSSGVSGTDSVGATATGDGRAVMPMGVGGSLKSDDKESSDEGTAVAESFAGSLPFPFVFAVIVGFVALGRVSLMRNEVAVEPALACVSVGVDGWGKTGDNGATEDADADVGLTMREEDAVEEDTIVEASDPIWSRGVRSSGGGGECGACGNKRDG